MEPPQILPGTSPVQRWLNRLRIYVRSLRFNDSPDFITQRTPNGWTIRLKDSGSAAKNNYLTWRVRVNGVLKDVDIDSTPPAEID
jgi:hypothetical protein